MTWRSASSTQEWRDKAEYTFPFLWELSVQHSRLIPTHWSLPGTKGHDTEVTEATKWNKAYDSWGECLGSEATVWNMELASGEQPTQTWAWSLLSHSTEHHYTQEILLIWAGWQGWEEPSRTRRFCFPLVPPSTLCHHWLGSRKLSWADRQRSGRDGRRSQVIGGRIPAKECLILANCPRSHFMHWPS